MSSARVFRKLLVPLLILAAPIASFAGISVSVTIAPPPLFVYQQPLCPKPGYIWTPGYWAYGVGGYYWVPGTWIVAPFVGALWTPGYWGWNNGVYLWNEGYWGPVVGFYGGINYGFGYFGHGYAGGRWNGGAFYYNRSVNNINVTSIHNVYNQSVTNNFGANRVSYNGGQGGIAARPTSTEMAAARERRFGATAEQTQLRQAAISNRAQLASANNGRPQTLATPRPSAFTGHAAAQASRHTANQVATAHGTASPGRPATNARTATGSASAQATHAEARSGKASPFATNSAPHNAPAQHTATTARRSALERPCYRPL